MSPAAKRPTNGVADVVARSSVLVCCGSGGVGKTTSAAAIALEAARRGRRVVVITIDPARRLADALGLADGLTNDPTRVDLSAVGTTAPDGELWAMMLDARATFDEVVRRQSGDSVQAERILANPFYRNIAGSLSGTQEYMAAEKLYDLHLDERFDLVVVDTPPTRRALDFLHAPERLARFLDHRLYRWLTAPARGSMRLVNVAAQPVLRTIGKVVGGDTLNEAIAFFRAFDGMEAGFRRRADAVMNLLAGADTTYVVVASPRHETVEEAIYFLGQLALNGQTAAAIVINRMQPNFGKGTAAQASRDADRARAAGDVDLALLYDNLTELRRQVDDEAEAVLPLLASAPDAQVARIPLRSEDVHDLGGIAAIAVDVYAVADPVRS